MLRRPVEYGVGVFVGPTLPCAQRVCEEDFYSGGFGDGLVIGEFHATVPSQRLHSPLALGPALTQGRGQMLGAAISQLHQIHFATGSIHQGRDLRVGAANDQVTFPVA